METLPQLIEQADLKQSELFFDPDAGKELLNIDEDRKHNKHNANTLIKREALRNVVCERLLSGCSQREVCRLFPVGRNTVAALVRRMEASGEMEPLKKRVSQKLGQVGEMGLDNLIEKLEKNEVPANVLPIVVGVALEKKALIDGDPTSRSETRIVEVTADDVLADLQLMKQVTPPKPAAIEAESVVVTEKPKDSA